MSKSIQLKKGNENMYPHPYYPVGSIYLSVNDTNPSTWFGGTWVQIAKGRTLVGVDTNDTDFNTVEKTGGEKKHTLTIQEMPSHRHEAKYGDVAGGDGSGYRYSNSIGQNGAIVQPVGGGQAHNNLQPYFTCYIWCRTA